jgi:short/branched chain acyl-CoA dehydrogenase
MLSFRPFLTKNSRRLQQAWIPRRRAAFSSAHVTDQHDLSDKEQWRHGPVTVFTEDETMIRDTVRQWAREELLPIVRAMDEECALRPEIVQSLFQQGFMGMEIPVEHQGSGLSFTSACLAVEEIARVDPSVAILVDIHNTLTNNAVRFWGSAELQERWLPRLATDTVSSFCLSEAGSGSDAFSLKTTAKVSSDGSFYTLNGTKLWISNAKEAGVFLVFANADPTQGYKGITAFMVDAQTEGISVGIPENKLGLRASSTCPVAFEDVRVSAGDVLGEVGMGYKYCINILNEGRIGIAAQQIGIAKGCFDIVMPYLNGESRGILYSYKLNWIFSRVTHEICVVSFLSRTETVRNFYWRLSGYAAPVCHGSDRNPRG